MNLDKTSNFGQKFSALNILLYRKLLPTIAGFIQLQLFLPSLFIDNVKSDHLYVVCLTNDSNNTYLRIRRVATNFLSLTFNCIRKCRRKKRVATNSLSLCDT